MMSIDWNEEIQRDEERLRKLRDHLEECIRMLLSMPTGEGTGAGIPPTCYARAGTRAIYEQLKMLHMAASGAHAMFEAEVKGRRLGKILLGESKGKARKEG